MASSVSHWATMSLAFSIVRDNSKAIIPGGGVSAHHKISAPITTIKKQTLNEVDFMPNT